VRTLALPDLILHSASHLFHEGEPDNLLRDLTDLDALLRLLGDDPAAWDALARRAERLQLAGPLRLALRYSYRLLGTPVPARLLTALGCLAAAPASASSTPHLRMLETQHPSAADSLRGAARKLLYIRAHRLRMLPYLLAYHLAHKLLFPPQADTRNLTADENNAA
jgi:hypothetical protein